MSENSDIKPVDAIDRHKFYFETPLYTLIKTADLIEDIWKGEIDAMSYRYDSPTTYDISTNGVAESYYTEFNGIYRVSLKNKRKEDEILIFFVCSGDDFVSKLGQLPSLATLQTGEVSRKYRSVLDKKHYSAFTKAIGLAANGIGAGSLVYLRKIFADLIDETYEAHKDSIGLSEQAYRNLRMDERVKKLKLFLPSQLVEMKSTYSILSSGVHNLSEEECLAYFRPLKLSIELILDQHIQQKQKTERDREVKAQIKEIEKIIKTKPEASA